MASIALELARETDNEELLQITGNISMPGFVKVAYRREPDFFKALKVEGRMNQVIVGRESKSGKIVGLGTRSIKPAYVNGKKMNIGYLSSLRVLKEYRGSVHLARGYELLRELHNDGEAAFYLSTMLNDNIIAQKLTKSRARLPAYHDIGQFKTMAISLSQIPSEINKGNFSIRTATLSDIDLIVGFLNKEGPRRQFSPAYSSEDFFTDNGLLNGLKPEDILLAFEDDQLKGIVAGWDQKSFRRSVVSDYKKWLALSKPLYNLWAKSRGLPTLPSVGSVLNYLYLSLTCIHGDREDIFLSLLRELMIMKQGSASFIMAGMHEKDPLYACLSRIRHFDYLSRLYAVCWRNGEEMVSALDNRAPYLELGSL